MKKAPTVFIRSFAALVLGTGIVSAAAWAAQPQPPAETAQAQPTLKPVNKLCPIMENEVDAEAPTRQFRGVTIGFCCPGCDRKWDRKSDEAKMALLTKMSPESVAAIIEDELDTEETWMVERPDGSLLCRGLAECEQVFARLGLEGIETDSKTLSGFLAERLGSVPPAGAQVDVQGFRFLVTKANNRRAERIRVIRLADAEPATDPAI